MNQPIPDRTDVQKRVLIVLSIAQILGGIGVAAGAAVGALLAADLSSDSFSGFSAASYVVGAALIAIPVSRLMDERGRRPGLMLAYGFGILGATIVVTAATIESFPLVLVGLILSGGGMTATLQSRYAASDLAPAARRGRDLSIVVWATTIGSVLGPNLSAPMGRFADSIGIPKLAGPYLLSMVVFSIAACAVFTFLRPDPLIEARSLEAAATGVKTHQRVKRSMRSALETISITPAAKLGLASVILGQAVMTSVMSMTPVHLRHSDASLRVIGLVISVHIAGMYAASPLVGWGVDRVGRKPVIATGCVILLASFAIAGTATGHESTQLGIGLTMLGLGWSCTMIAGSTLLTDAIPIPQRPNVQGTADVMMGFGGATAGLLAGLVVSLGSYALLTVITTALILPLLMITLLAQPRPQTQPVNS